MDDLLQILAVVAFILFGILGSKKKKRVPPQSSRLRSRPALPRLDAPATRGGTAQEDLLRELEGLLTGRPPRGPHPQPVSPPEVPDPSEAVSLEPVDAEETARWEAGLNRAAKVHETAAWEEGLHRRARSLETLEGAGEESHARFHERYDQPAPSTTHAVRHHPVADVRRAVVWMEILGPPVSMRD